MTKRLMIAAASLVLLIGVACGGPSLDAAAVETTDEVAVRDSKFAPRSIEVPAGTTVTWRWEGNSKHNVKGDGWESPILDDGRFEHEFTEPGVYDYKCELHSGMTGRVTVTE